MIETTCKDCVFARSENGEQESCDLNRLEKLGFHKDEKEKCFVVERFCNTARPQEWVDSLSFEESLDLKKTVMKEVVPRIGFLLYFDSETKDPLKSLEKNISEIMSQKYLPRYIIIANEKVEYNQAIQKILAESLPEEVHHHIVQMLQKPNTKVEIIDECFKHALNGWVYVTTCGEKIPNTLMQTFNRLINEDMEKITVVKPYDGFNGMVFQAALFKFLNGNKPKVWSVEDVDQRPFLEKVKDLDKEQSIMSWEEFNAKLS